MTAIDFSGSRARHVRQTFAASTQAAATELVASGLAVYGFEMTNPHTVAVAVSGVPLWEDPTKSNVSRVGIIIPASGTVISNIPFVAESGLKFYSVSAAGTSTHIRVFTE